MNILLRNIAASFTSVGALAATELPENVKLKTSQNGEVVKYKLESMIWKAVPKKPEAEQPDIEQPINRPDSKPAGGDKPQPDAELTSAW